MGQLFGGRLRLAGNDVIFIEAAPATIEALNTDDNEPILKQTALIAESSFVILNPFSILLFQP